MMRQVVITAIGCVLWTVSATAQPIHQHPQKAAYASQAEWPFLDLQCHWAPGNDMAPGVLPSYITHSIAHTHIGLTAPIYSEIAGPVVVPFSLKLFHTQGRLTGFSGANIRDIVFDETGTSALPNAVGDPMGLRTITGHFTLDPSYSQYGDHLRPPAHGWWSPMVNARVQYDNGDVMQMAAIIPVFSMVDPSAPVTTGAHIVGSMCDPISAHDFVDPVWGPIDDWGVVVTEIREMLPLAPISAPWPLLDRAGSIPGAGGIQAYTYGVPRLFPAPAFYELRRDPDFHNGMIGTLLTHQETTSDQALVVEELLDPAVLGSGTHKLMFNWTLQSGGGDERIAANQLAAAIVTVNVTVGDGVPPPPPPPPDPTWLPIVPTFWQLDNLLKICTPDAKCIQLGPVQ